MPDPSPFARAGWTETTNRPPSWHHSARDDDCREPEHDDGARGGGKAADFAAADEWARRGGVR